jgi:hypothetical protein
MCLAADGGEGAPPTSTAERGTRAVGVSTSVGDSVSQLRRAHAGIQVPHVPVVVLDRRTSSSDRSIELPAVSTPFVTGRAMLRMSICYVHTYSLCSGATRGALCM